MLTSAEQFDMTSGAMRSYLSLKYASLIHLRGWGKPVGRRPNYEAENIRVELIDVGELALYGPGFLREKLIGSMSIEHLELRTSTKIHTTGGGWIGGGSSLIGTLAGAGRADALNALTTKTGEYALLIAIATLPNGARREATVALGHLSSPLLANIALSALDRHYQATGSR